MSYRTTIQCGSCGSFVVPRVHLSYGNPMASFCPICGGMIQDFRAPNQKYIEYVLPAIFIILITYGIFAIFLGY